MTQSLQSQLMVLFFSDIASSTELKSAIGTAAYSRLLARHDQLFRMTLAAYPDAQLLKDLGDGFLARFSSASDAVRAALQFEYALAHGPQDPALLKVRIGIHLGEVSAAGAESDGQPKLVGINIDLAARVMALAAPAQILLTRPAFDQAREFVDVHPPAGEQLPPLKWLAHGSYLFRGINEPVEIFEVGAEGFAPLAAPPDGEKARRSVSAEDEAVLGWRPAAGLFIPGRESWMLERRLGEGGFGEVWLARHRKLAQKRVFKFCFDAARLRSFKREMTLFRLLREALGERKDIARLYDVKLEEPPFLLESEYTQGGDLGDWVQRQGGAGSVPLAVRLELVARTAEAVAAAHSVGVLHKDIKPSNILIYEEEGQPRPRLSDFGIGMLNDRGQLRDRAITETGFTVISENDSSRTGTRMYAPPELLTGRPFTIQGDVYALGVLLYQMAVGDLQRPLASGWERDVADDLLREDIAACVDGDPARRLSSAAELAERLRRLERRRTEREALAASHRLARRRRRRLRIAAVLAGLLVVLTALSVAGLLYERWKNERIAGAERQASQEWQRAEKNRKLAENRLAESLMAQGDAHGLLQDWSQAKRAYSEASSLLIRLGGKAVWADAALALAHRSAPPALWQRDSGESALLAVGPIDENYDFHAFSRNGAVSRWNALTGMKRRDCGSAGEEVIAAAISPQGTTGLSIDWKDRKAVLWDLSSGQAKPLSIPLQDVITCISLSDDARQALVGDLRGQLAEWDLQANVCRRTIQAHRGYTWAAALSRDGRYALTGGEDHEAKIWDLREPSPQPRTLKGHLWYVKCVAWSSDGRMAVSGSADKTVRVWDAATAREVRRFEHKAKITAVGFAFSNRYVVAAGDDGMAIVWDLLSRHPVYFLEHPDNVSAFGLGNTGELATGTTGGKLTLWGLSSKPGMWTCQGHDGRVRVAAISPDGRFAASGGDDRRVRLWDLATGCELAAMSRPDPITSLAFSPDGTRLLTGGSQGPVCLWNWREEKLLLRFYGHDGLVLARADGSDGQMGEIEPSGTITMSFGHSGETHAGVSRHASLVNDVQFSPDGRMVATASGDGTARLWDAASGNPLHTLTTGKHAVAFARFTAGGQVVTADQSGSLCFWSVASGTLLDRQTAHQKQITAMAVSRDALVGLTAGAEGRIKRWDLQQHRQIADFPALGTGVDSIALCDDASVAISICRDEQMRLWDAETGRELRRLGSGASATALAPDGRLLIWGTRSGSLAASQFLAPACFTRASGSAHATTQLSVRSEAAVLREMGEWYASQNQWRLAFEALHRCDGRDRGKSSLTLARAAWVDRNYEYAYPLLSTLLATDASLRTDPYAWACFDAVRRARHPAAMNTERFWVAGDSSQAGPRIWIKVSDTEWQEQPLHGSARKHRIISRWAAALGEGYVLRPVPEDGTELFVPEIAEGAWLSGREIGKEPWKQLAALRLGQPGDASSMIPATRPATQSSP